MDEITLVILGGLSTFLATYLIDTLRYKRKDKDTLVSFLLKIKLELEAANKILENLKSSLEYRNFFEFSKIAPAEKQTEVLEEVKKNIHRLPITMQGNFLTLVLEYSALIREVGFLENFATDEVVKIGTPEGTFSTSEEYHTHFNRARLQKLISLTDIKRKIDDFNRAIETQF